MEGAPNWKVKLDVLKPTSGIALIIVMMVIVVLGIMAAGFAYSMKVETSLARNAEADPDMELLGRAGVELARYVLGQQLNIPAEAGFDALNQKWAGGPGGTNQLLAEVSLQNNELGRGRFSVRIIDLERRVNVNYANRPVLERAMEFLGLDLIDASTIVDSIEDWRDRNPDPQILARCTSYRMGAVRLSRNLSYVDIGLIDPTLAAVLDHKLPAKPQLVAELRDAVKFVNDEAGRRDEKYQQIVEAEKNKSKVLEAKFQELFKKAKDEPITKPLKDIDLD